MWGTFLRVQINTFLDHQASSITKKNMQAILHFLFSITILISILTNPHSHALATFKNHDHEALLAIKAQISNDPYSALSSWNSSTSLHFCHWNGVTCGRRHQRVVGLELPHSKLVGALSPYIANLSFLRVLDLYNNSFRGDIPSQISSLSRLRGLRLSRNYFEGEISANLSRCLNLKFLYLGFNKLVGKIPSHLTTLPSLIGFSVQQNNLIGVLQDLGIGNFSTSLQRLYLSENQLEGSIPNDIGRLVGLTVLGLSVNKLHGIIPLSLYNLSSLNSLDLGENKFHGSLPQDLGLRLPRLSRLLMEDNSLIGQFPISISNLSELESISISYNSFRGKFNFDGSNMPYLSILAAYHAFSSGKEVRDLAFLETLTNCTKLTELDVSDNSFTGHIPPSLFSLSTNLEYLSLQSNQILGEIPLGLGKFVNLQTLWLHDNYLTGPLPSDIGKMVSIQAISISNNILSGEIPHSLGNMIHLFSLDVGYNNFQGSLPESLGNCTNLQKMSAQSNNFSGSFPTVLFRISSIIKLYVGQNNFEGTLPVEIGSLKNLIGLDVSQNRFSGEIPSTLSECTSLTILDVSQNSFTGSIPKSFSSLKSIVEFDLSSNHFSGQIPYYFSTWPFLLDLNLSFNDLSGDVPTHGIFANTSAISIVGNDKLCGGVLQLHLPRCSEPKRRILSSRMIMIISITSVLIVALSVSICLYFLCSSRKRKDPPSGPPSIRSFLEVSYQMLHTATEGFSMSNLIGVGGFGSVYKGVLPQDDTELVVAVKVMNLGNEGASKSFILECKALRNIRHRNLVKVITACSSIDAQRNDFKALVYEFMPKGSLEDWLHSPNRVPVTSTEDGRSSLSLLQRLGITIDVASALEYLLIECANPIIHCDLKPSNILLDDDMVAHVGDFGLAKFVPGALTSSTTNNSSSYQVRGTVGYAAPEYGIGSKVSPEGDIYSLGIIILELMTSKKPTDPMFNNGLNLHDFAKSTLPDRVMEIIDHKMLGDTDVFRARNAADFKKRECIKSIIRIGVECSMEMPKERMAIKDVVNELNSARKNLQART